MPPTKPDILLVVLDTLRRDRLSAYGYQQETSPVLDAFAAQSTVFERAISPAQWTIPAHASMFTGLYPGTHNVIQADDRLSGSHPTLAEILQNSGYHTAGFCNNPLVGVLYNGLSRGFDDFYNYAGAAPNRPLDVHQNRLRRALSRRWRRFALEVTQHFARSDWLFRTSLHPWLTPIWTRYINYKGHTSNSIQDLIGYMQRHNANHDSQPLFAFLNLMGAHLPYRPPRDFLRKIAPDVERDRAAYRFMGRFNADAARWASPVESPLTLWEYHVIDSFYRAEIAYQDAQLHQLFEYLRTSGKLEDMLVIMVADHGEGHGDHDFFGHSFVVYQELVHVPLVIHYPAAFPAGTRIKTNVSTRRIFHTILETAGAQPPLAEDDPNANIDALTLARATNGRADSENNLVFTEAYPPDTFVSLLRHHQPDIIRQRSLDQVRRGIYQDDHKLAVAGNHVEGFFDVHNDPREHHNIAAAHTDTISSLQVHLNQFTELTKTMRPENMNGTLDPNLLRHLRALGYIE